MATVDCVGINQFLVCPILSIERQTMTQNEFLRICLQHNVTPAVALENDAIREALLQRDDALVQRLLLEAL